MSVVRAHAFNSPSVGARVKEGIAVSYRSRQLLRLSLFVVGAVLAFVGEYVAVRTKDNGLEYGAIAVFVGCLVAVTLDAAKDSREPPDQDRGMPD